MLTLRPGAEFLAALDHLLRAALRLLLLGDLHVATIAFCSAEFSHWVRFATVFSK